LDDDLDVEDIIDEDEAPKQKTQINHNPPPPSQHVTNIYTNNNINNFIINSPIPYVQNPIVV
jgi:hypothetical protein